jgi:hypothetical protein
VLTRPRKTGSSGGSEESSFEEATLHSSV